MPLLNGKHILLMVGLIVLLLVNSDVLKNNNLLYEVYDANEIEVMDVADTSLTTDKVNINTKQSNYIMDGKYINKNIANINISEVFSDFEILTILKRIEGYYDSASRIAISHNNPCNLKYGVLPKKYGAIVGKQEVFYGEGDYYAKFPTVDQGNDACIELISVMKKKYPTIRKFFTRWSSNEGGIVYTNFVNNLVNIDNYPLDYHGTTF